MNTKDQMGRKISFSFPPKKIISIVPSQSEFLWDLGLREELVGITKFCIHTEKMFRTVARVGGTKKLNINKIIELQPDLVIGNMEENEKSDIAELEKKFPVWMSEIYNLKDAYEMMLSLGEITNKKKKAAEIVDAIKDKHQLFQKNKPPLENISTAYFIWKGPYMVAGKNNFIDFMLEECGFTNVFSQKKYSKNDFENKNERYPAITTEQLIESNPKLILLSSEPFPFKEKHVKEISEILPEAKIFIVDGELFSWYGSRMKKAFPYLKKLMMQIDKAVNQEG
jgi:ABC-type Fe3+-hydroxamate transport system substrate-binding protein